MVALRGRTPRPPASTAAAHPPSRVSLQSPVRPRPLSLPIQALRHHHPPWPVASLTPAGGQGPNCCLCCLGFCCCFGSRVAATQPPPGPPRPWLPMAWPGTSTLSDSWGTGPQPWALAPRTWLLSTCFGFMRNTAKGARGLEGATQCAASGPSWVSRGP